MKGICFERHGGIEVLEYRDDLPVPTLSSRDVLIRICASAMNYNDVWARTGLPGMDFILPHISGSDGAGIVEAVGSEVDQVSVGDEVMVNSSFGCGECPECVSGVPMRCPRFEIWGFSTGAYQGAQGEYGRAPARNVLPKPKNLDWEGTAAIGSVLATAYRMLVTRAHMKAGDTVLIWGATGGMGMAAIQLCKVFGATVIAIAGNEKKCELAAELGADHVLNRRRQRIALEVLKLTGRRGVDIVLEHVGAASWETSTHCLKWGGTIVTCGATTGFKAPMDIRFLWNKEQNYLGSHTATTAEQLEALRFVESGQIKPQVMEVLPLKDIARGHELLESGEVYGKIVLVPS